MSETHARKMPLGENSKGPFLTELPELSGPPWAESGLTVQGKPVRVFLRDRTPPPVQSIGRGDGRRQADGPGVQGACPWSWW